MHDVFISYVSENVKKAEVLATSLEEEGFTVWWDRLIAPGKTWDEVIGSALDSAKCVVVLWSEESVKSRWVREEADRAVGRQCLVPVLIEQVQPPFGFERIEAANLVDWKGDQNHPEFQLLRQAVADHVGKEPDHERPRREPVKRVEEKITPHDAAKKRKVIFFLSAIVLIGVALLIRFVIWQDPSQDKVDLRLKRLISQIFEDELERRQKAADLLVREWYSNPDLIPPLLKFASQNRKNRNGIYNTVVVLNGIDQHSLIKHQESVLSFLAYAKNNGAKTKGVVLQVCKRFTNRSVRDRCID